MSRLVVTARLTEENERHSFMFCRIAWFDLVTFNGFFQRNSNESKIKINQNDSNRLFVLVHSKLRKRLASHRLLCPVQRRLTCSLSSRRSVLGVHRPLGAWLGGGNPHPHEMWVWLIAHGSLSCFDKVFHVLAGSSLA